MGSKQEAKVDHSPVTPRGSRKFIIGGNWKCNGSVSANKALVDDVLNKLQFDTKKGEVVVSPISLHLTTIQALVKDNV